MVEGFAVLNLKSTAGELARRIRSYDGTSFLNVSALAFVISRSHEKNRNVLAVVGCNS